MERTLIKSEKNIKRMKIKPMRNILWCIRNEINKRDHNEERWFSYKIKTESYEWVRDLETPTLYILEKHLSNTLLKVDGNSDT